MKAILGIAALSVPLTVLLRDWAFLVLAGTTIGVIVGARWLASHVSTDPVDYL